MAIDGYIEVFFLILCYGRDFTGNNVLSLPVRAKVKVSQPYGNETDILLSVQCEFNTGGHGQRCKASHPGLDKVGDGVLCPYAIDIPYAMDNIKKI